MNREPWELDPRMFSDPVPPHANVRSPRVAGGLGTVPRLVGEGQDIYPRRLPLGEALSRIETIYKPYHDQLKRLITRTHSRFGFAVLVDCHSMPASVRVGDAGIRPDFIIGDRFGASAASALSEHAIGLLVSMGYTVAHNKPYAGGSSPSITGGRRGGCTPSDRVNRGLYMNEKTLERSGGFDALALDMTRVVADLMAIPEFHFTGLPRAAE